jgi:hypothetical protein
LAHQCQDKRAFFGLLKSLFENAQKRKEKSYLIKELGRGRKKILSFATCDLNSVVPTFVQGG